MRRMRAASGMRLARGYDISGLRARQLTVADFQRFDLLLAMDEDNLADMRALAPHGHRGTGAPVSVLVLPTLPAGGAGSLLRWAGWIRNRARSGRARFADLFVALAAIRAGVGRT